jgi:DNA-binding GntR family transcriptional regulator
VSSISRTVLREQVKDILLQRIVRGELAAGERLVETRIAQELGTSQGPVREALRDLELLRLVESEPFRGSRVRAFDDAALIEIYPVRVVLEELAAQLATVRLAGDVSTLESELESMRAAALAHDLSGLTSHDIAFHRRLVEASGNTVLEHCWKSLGVEGRITLTIYDVHQVHVPPARAAELHVPLLEAIREQDPTRAGREAREHIEYYARLTASRLGSPAPSSGDA